MSLAFTIYNNSPIIIQNLVCSLYGSRESRKRYGPMFVEKLEFLRESQWFSKGEIANYQDEQLRVLVNNAYQNIPYYNELFREIKLHPKDIQGVNDLKKIPILTKEDVRRHWQKMIDRNYQKTIYKSHTSGSTGKALNFYLTSDSIQFHWAVWWRFRERFGVHLGDKSLNFIGKLVVPIKQKKPPFWRYNKPSNQYVVNMQHIKEQNAADFVDFINKQDFKFFSGYPSIISVLADIIENTGLKIANGPKVIMTGAETLYDNQRVKLERVFGCPAVDHYGFSEGAGNTSKCENHIFHEDFEFGILERDDPNSDEEGDLLATGFANYAMPFIRYRVGDTAQWSSKTCDCGRNSARIRKIEGRSEDYIVTPEGAKIMRFDYIFKDMGNIKECQVRQRELGEVEFIIVARRHFSPRDEQKLKKLVSEWVSPTINTNIRLVNEIPRTRTGKFRAVVSELN